jgi:hypothetical protein
MCNVLDDCSAMIDYRSLMIYYMNYELSDEENTRCFECLSSLRRLITDYY